MPRVSVIIPSYNHEKYVAETIQSVLDQTYKNFEIIITDDGSADGTVAEIRKFKDERIRLFCLERNSGSCVAANNCLKEASGEYLALLNSDDAFLANKLEKQVAFLDDHSHIAAVFGYAKIIDDAGNDFTDKTHFYYNIFDQPNRNRYEWLRYFFYKSNCLCDPSALIRKKCFEDLGYYDGRLRQLGDLEFLVRLCLKSDIHIIQENLVRFRVRKGEENTSGMSLGNSIRYNYELSHILSHYLRIPSVDELRKIFGDPLPFDHPLEDDLMPFYVAMLALDVDSPAHQIFGLNTLYKLLQDREMAKQLSTRCSFTYPDFFKLTGKYDIFNIGNIWVDRLQEKERDGTKIVAQKELIRNFASMHRDQDNLRQHATNLEKERGELRQHATNLERERNNLRQHATNLEKERGELRQHATNLERERGELTRRVVALHDELSNVNGRVESLEQMRQQLEERQGSLQRELAEIRDSFVWRSTSVLRRLISIRDKGYKTHDHQSTPRNSQAILSNLEVPAETRITVVDTCPIRGWTCSRNGIDSVKILIDGKRVQELLPEIERPDVALVYPDIPGSGRPGFDVTVQLGRLSEGAHELEVVILDSAGNECRHLRSLQVYVNPYTRRISDRKCMP